MVKNVIDIVFGGMTYFTLGFGFTFGNTWPNGFIGIGRFLFNPPDTSDPSLPAWSYAAFLFQLSFATTTSTIVSGANLVKYDWRVEVEY